MIPAFLRLSEKEKSVYFVGRNDTPQYKFPPITSPSYSSSTRRSARIVAYFELVTTFVFWLPVLDIPHNFYLWMSGGIFDYTGGEEWDSLMFATAGTIARFFATIFLLFGTFQNKSWYPVPYLLVQMMLLFGGPFVFIYASLGYNATTLSCLSNVGWVAMLPILFGLVWLEYIKWRSVYNFYDSLTAKQISTEFGKMIDNQNMKTKEPSNVSAEEWYLKLLYGSAIMEEINPKEAESLVPLQSPEQTSKE